MDSRIVHWKALDKHVSPCGNSLLKDTLFRNLALPTGKPKTNTSPHRATILGLKQNMQFKISDIMQFLKTQISFLSKPRPSYFVNDFPSQLRMRFLCEGDAQTSLIGPFRGATETYLPNLKQILSTPQMLSWNNRNRFIVLLLSKIDFISPAGFGRLRKILYFGRWSNLGTPPPHVKGVKNPGQALGWISEVFSKVFL